MSVPADFATGELITAARIKQWTDVMVRGGGRNRVVMRHGDGINDWKVYAPDGSEVSTTGTTTQGLQEAINYARTNGYGLEVIGGQITPLPGVLATSRITCSTPITIGTAHTGFYHFRGVDLLFTGSASADFITFDSADMLDFAMYAGQIIYSGNASAIRINGTNDNGESFIGWTSSRLRIATIAIVNSGTLAPESTHGVGIRFSPANGHIINLDIYVAEINGGLIGIQVDNPAGSNTFRLNRITSPAIHFQGSASVTAGTSSIASSKIFGNKWDLIVNPDSGGNGVSIWGNNDTWDLSIGAGAVGVLLNSSASRHLIRWALNAATTRLTDSSTAKNHTLLTAEAPARSTLTPSGSPYKIQNTTGRPCLIFVSGGTVSEIAVSMDDATYDAATSPPTNSFWWLPPGGWLRITYSVAPTFVGQYA